MQLADSHEAQIQPSSEEQLKSALESLLFVAGRPLEHTELRRLLAITESQLDAALAALATECEKRGVRVQRLGAQVQLVSAPENSRYIAAFLGLPTQVKLTTAALETLAVITYRQPSTRGQIETIRGVNSDRALASLIAHSLVTEVGRAATAGRPVLFATTPEFLHQFGLTSLDHLPRLDSADETLEALAGVSNGASGPATEANGHSKTPGVPEQLALPSPDAEDEEAPE